MNKWKEYKLGKVIDLIGGGTPKTTESEYWNGNIPWLSVVDFNTDNKYVYNTEKTITEEGLKNSSTKMLNKGDIIISARGTVGALAVLGKDMTFNQSCYGIRAKKDFIDQEYLYYLLKNAILAIKQNAHGGVFDTITKGTFDEIDVEIPAIEEQKRIAAVLSSLDEKIDLLHRQNKTLESLAETMFRKWFIEDAEDGWENVRIGDHVKTNAASIGKDFDQQIIRYLDTGSLTEGKIDGYQTINLADAPSRARRIVKHNDILISTVRPDQKHFGIIKNPARDIIASTGFCVITCDKIDPHFMYVLLTTDEMTEYLHSIAEGSTSTYPSLKPSDIENIEFKLPPYDKLDTFSKYSESAWKKLDYNQIQIIALSKLKSQLLPQLIEGQMLVEI